MDPIFITASIIILLFSVVLHEVMHGYVALKFGDRTALNAGRLTLNPIPHVDPIGTVLMPAIFYLLPMLTGIQPGFFIAWAKPVPVNPLNFSDIKKGELFVSLAGVISNFFLAVLAAFIYHILPLDWENFLTLQNILFYAVYVNLMLGIFNLIPIPPLDGSKVLLSQLPYRYAKEYEKLTPYGFIILIALLYTGVISTILGTILHPLYRLLIS